MDYLIKPVDVTELDVRQKVNLLLSETFGEPVSDDQVEKATQTNSSSDSLYLAAVIEDEIIGFNAFISHDLILNGATVNAYQSCWTATSDAHRGKKIFQNLINTAKDILLARNAAFIFGFPNTNSQPIFTKKLGFREIPSLKWQVPNIGAVMAFYVKIPKTDVASLEINSIQQNDRQLIDLKKKKYQDELLLAEYDDSFVWGTKRRAKRFGINLQYFEIGGMSIGNPQNVKPLFTSLCRKMHKINYFQLTSSFENSYHEFFNNLRPAQTNDLIVFDLNLKTERDLRFNFFGGVKDVF